MFGRLHAVVIDELHAYIPSPRGKQLQSLLHRLEGVLGRRVRRIGLSATLGNMRLAAQFLRPVDPDAVETIEASQEETVLQLKLRGYRERAPKPARPGSTDDGAESEPNDWHVQAIADDIYSKLRGGHHLVFANARSSVERYADRLRRMCDQKRVPNEFHPHHGSLSKELREYAEARLKDSELPATAVCTSTLELGIDIGDVESIAQIGAPFSVASLRQRLGRSGRRSKSPTLRMYISEPEVTAASPVLDTLHTEMVQAVAMISLLRDRWCEPPELGALHLSTLVQQVLSYIAQLGGVKPRSAWVALCERGPFASVDQSRFAALLRCMAREQLIEQAADGDLLLGAKGERIVEHFSFYAVFSTPEEFRIEHAGRTLGSLSVDLSIAVGIHIIFAGRRWKVVDIDSTARIVFVEPAPGGRAPRFEGSRGGLVHDEIRRRMRQVYESADQYDWLDGCAAELLGEARQAYARLQLRERCVVADGSDTLLFLCRGDRIMCTAAVTLLARGLAVEVTGPAITVLNIRPEAVVESVRAIVSGPAPDPEQLARCVGNKIEGKYDWVLDDQLLCAEYAARNLAVADAIGTLRLVVG
jgi:ATP-dependent Lhr-like helicase